jgi:hypothetical protein
MALLNNRIADMGSKGKCKAVDETRAWLQAKRKVKDDIRVSKVVTHRHGRPQSI